jgi:hypothetical protein
MKFEEFQLRGNNSVCVGAFQLLRGRAPAQLRGNIVFEINETDATFDRFQTTVMQRKMANVNTHAFWDLTSCRLVIMDV